MQVIGVIGAAVVIAPVLSLLLEAYGIGVPTADHPKPLRAPQATLMASVAEGVFEGGLPWTMVGIGMVIAIAVIAVDRTLEKRGSRFRTPVLAVAVGIYLPFELSVPILVGGLAAHFASRVFDRRKRATSSGAAEQKIEEERTVSSRNGLLFGAGLITGEALVGIAMAVPIVIAGDENILAFWGAQDVAWPGAVLLGIVSLMTYRVASKSGRS